MIHSVISFFSKYLDGVFPQKVQSGQCGEIVNGQFSVNGKEVTNSTQVNGQLKAKDAVFKGIMEVNGEAQCIECTFQGPVLFRGNAKLEKSSFLGDLEVMSRNLDLDQVKADEVYVTDPLRSLTSHRQKVFLKNNSAVRRIVFSRPGGIVYFSKGSSVESVENGKALSTEE